MRIVVLALLGLSAAAAATARADEAAEIARFNHAVDEATRTMNNGAMLKLWEEDGVSLLPNQAPLVGKKALAKFFDGVTKAMPLAKMTTFEFDCHDVRVDGRMASEWCNEHQVVELGNGKPPFDGRGKMLLVLHKSDDGRWRLQKEMWNP
ncbi:MAG TPA: nuclear transport factor 2 family protein [Polyangia bacterium]